MKDEKDTQGNDEMPMPEEPGGPRPGFYSWAPILAPDDSDDGLKIDLNDSDQIPLF